MEESYDVPPGFVPKNAGMRPRKERSHQLSTKVNQYRGIEEADTPVVSAGHGKFKTKNGKPAGGRTAESAYENPFQATQQSQKLAKLVEERAKML